VSARDHLSANDRLRRVLGPAERQLTCEQCFDLLDRYAELEAGGGDAGAAVPGMSAHLEGCPACAEDCASLVALLRARRRTSGE
jgi:hypothetical protein